MVYVFDYKCIVLINKYEWVFLYRINFVVVIVNWFLYGKYGIF